MDDPSTTMDDQYVGERIIGTYFDANSSDVGHVMTIVGYNDHIWTDINGNGVVDPVEKGMTKQWQWIRLRSYVLRDTLENLGYLPGSV